MALVDFTNAVLTPPTVFAADRSDLGLNTVRFNKSANTNQVNSNGTCTRLTNEQKKEILAYTGNFTDSGTEFYIGWSNTNNSYNWKVSGITFQSGDAYSFQIPITIVTN